MSRFYQQTSTIILICSNITSLLLQALPPNNKHEYSKTVSCQDELKYIKEIFNYLYNRL